CHALAQRAGLETRPPPVKCVDRGLTLTSSPNQWARADRDFLPAVCRRRLSRGRSASDLLDQDSNLMKRRHRNHSLLPPKDADGNIPATKTAARSGASR